jgi:1-acyl-sn-glycerol-3-phosphate acyltransferase
MNSRFSRPAVAVFELFFRPWMALRMRVLCTGLPLAMPPDRPALLVANHVSWWDGFIARNVQRRFRPGAPMFSLMTASELNRFPALRLLGAIGIERGSAPSVRRAIRTAEALVAEDPEATVLIFPQGRIWPSSRRPLGFESGVESFATRLAAVVIPMGIHVEPLNRIAPTAFVSLGEPMESTSSALEVEAVVEMELDRINEFLALHGEHVVRVWPPPYGRLARDTAERSAHTS